MKTQVSASVRKFGRTFPMAATMRTALLSFAILASVTGYRNGKVEKSCESMVPRHGGEPNTTTSPYSLTVDTSKFSPGDHVQVTLSGSKPFEGFLIEARDARSVDGPAVGSFILLSPDNSQLLPCHNIQGSGVSHTSEARKTEVSVVWAAPSAAPPAVHFLATVVAHYSHFWIKIPSPVITQSGVTPPPIPSTGSTSSAPETTAALLQPFSSEGCGVWKSCLLDPAGCDPAVDPDCFFLSYRAEGQSVRFELSGPATGYVSFALSQDKWMGDDDVYLCVNDGGRVRAEAAYTTGRGYPEAAEKSVLRDVSWRLAGGLIQCSFRRAVDVPEDPQRFSLARPHILFLAQGTAQRGHINKHERQPLISDQPHVITASPEIVLGSHSPLIMKYHGVLMLLAWMEVASTAIFFAGFFKPDWPEKTLFGQKVWFQVHRGLMLLMTVLTTTGFILPFIYRRGCSTEAAVHVVLGWIVMALSVVQPIMAALRPAPDSSRRWIFRWLHWGVGNAAEVFAVAAMFVGMQQQSLRLPFHSSTVILSCFIVWMAFSKLILAIHRGLFQRGSESPDEHAILPDPSARCKWGTRSKLVVFSLFVAGNTVLCISLICSISTI
ncbi:putative ferric-chelate reductase 1 [Brachyhypopomus gauderio]|uniref:putative ferric-chelate reductase 1 n=1 Tax=Brachyhypopomus gauderio TaxID=698409 RepID=UPI004040FA5D